MQIAVFGFKPYDREFLVEASEKIGHELHFFEAHLRIETTPLAKGFPAVCVFVNDTLDRATIQKLAEGGTRHIALRCAGFNNVDLEAAREFGLHVVNVPEYSPHAVAEHAVALILSLNRKIHRAYARVREGNFALEGLLGFDLFGKTIGVIGTGRIGQTLCTIMQGFGCQVLAFDVQQTAEVAARYVTLPELLSRADIVSLHCPLNKETHHIINENALRQMKRGVMLINTGRGALIDTEAVVQALKTGKIGYLGLDVYEQETELFFEDLSSQIIQDDTFARLVTFPNVLITGHQAFFTAEALRKIARTTLQNISDLETGACANEVILRK